AGVNASTPPTSDPKYGAPINIKTITKKTAMQMFTFRGLREFSMEYCLKSAVQRMAEMARIEKDMLPNPANRPATTAEYPKRELSCKCPPVMTSKHCKRTLKTETPRSTGTYPNFSATKY